MEYPRLLFSEFVSQIKNYWGPNLLKSISIFVFANLISYFVCINFLKGITAQDHISDIRLQIISAVFLTAVVLILMFLKSPFLVYTKMKNQMEALNSLVKKSEYANLVVKTFSDLKTRGESISPNEFTEWKKECNSAIDALLVKAGDLYTSKVFNGIVRDAHVEIKLQSKNFRDIRMGGQKIPRTLLPAYDKNNSVDYELCVLEWVIQRFVDFLVPITH